MEADFEYWNVNFTGITTIMLEFGPRQMLGMADKCGFAGTSVLDEINSAVTVHFSNGFDYGLLKSLEWLKSRAALSAVNSLMRIACWVVAWLMSIMPQTHPDRWGWKPFICCSSIDLRAMIIAPNNTIPAIPQVLFRSEYDRLPRVWLLEPNNHIVVQTHRGGWVVRLSSLANRFCLRMCPTTTMTQL
jgi:hypothetical protein